MNNRSLLASNLGVAAGTLASRVTGLLRIIAFAAVIGQTSLADAFDVGNNAPNVIYELLIGGTLAATLVPAFTQFRERNDRDATAPSWARGSLRSSPSRSLPLLLRHSSFGSTPFHQQAMQKLFILSALH